MGAGLALWDLQTGTLPQWALSSAPAAETSSGVGRAQETGQKELPVVPGDAMPRAPQRGQQVTGPTWGTVWHQLSDGTARGRLGTQWASNALPVLTRAPRALQILVAMNPGGQGWGGERPNRRQERRADGPGAWRAAGLTGFLCRNNRKELRTNPGCHCPQALARPDHTLGLGVSVPGPPSPAAFASAG